MGSQLHVFFFPFMSPGHMIPMVDMAKLFAKRGCRSTIITVPSSEQVILQSIEKTRRSGRDIGVAVVKLPLKEVGLSPEDGDFKSLQRTQDTRDKFMKAVRLLDRQLEELLEERRPDCLVADMFFPWATEVAARCGIPRLVYHGTSYFSLGASECVRLYEPHKKVSSDTEPFVIPNFPGEIAMTRSKLPDYIREETQRSKLHWDVKESEIKSYGVIVNSFYELEAAHADHYRGFLGRRAWQIGPLSLSNKELEDKASGGDQASIDRDHCITWLSSKEPNSIAYICFGSRAGFTSAQLHEIAVGLEGSGQQFIWVVNKESYDEEGKEGWLPEGFDERMANRGMIIRGWAPQVLILEHEAVGGFMTHCGWNSTLEGVSAGVPMVTWPVDAEQFYNEKLITEVLGIGVPVGVKRWVRRTGDSVSAEAVERALRRIMVGDGAEELRRRSKNLSEMAKRAVGQGGSSYADLDRLLEELCRKHTEKP